MLYHEFRLLHPTGIDVPPGALVLPLEPLELPRAQIEQDYLAAYAALKEAL